MVAVSALLGVPGAASAEEITVNDDSAGPGPVNGNCAAADHATITDAVDAAVAGDTILVCAGTYNESVEVDKQLALRGAQAGVDAGTREPAIAADESLITGEPSASSDGGVALEASGIVLDGFAIAFAADPAIDAGITLFPGEDDNQVINNVLSDNAVGISASSSGGARIEGNLLTNTAGSAVRLAGGIDGMTVQGNTMLDNGFAGVRVTATGAGANANVSVLGNTMAGNDAGISVNEDSLSGALTANGNRIVDNATGIALDDGDATVLADDNWWGCNEGLPSPDCDSTGGANPDGIDTSQVLRLTIDAPRKMRAGKKRTVRASLVGGAPCLFPDHTSIGYTTNLGRIRSLATAATSNCVSTVRLKIRRRQRGKSTVSAALDNQAVEDTVRIKKKN